MSTVPATTDSFSRHILAGFKPHVPHIQYPVTLGLYQEGDNLALFLAPTDLALVRQLTGVPASDHALVLHGAAVLDDAFLQAEPQAKRINWADVDQFHDDVDVIHIPKNTPVDLEDLDILTPILAAPHQAVPTDLGSRVAIGLNDGCHGVIISPDHQLIQGCLTGFIEAYTTAATGRRCPKIQPDLVAALLQPMQAGEWMELRLLPHKKIFAIELAIKGDDTNASRWVCGGNDLNWRDGWSW
jgi:hypothetical protein